MVYSLPGGISVEFGKLSEASYFHFLILQDKLLDSYMRTGSFTKENDLPDYPSHPMPRRPYSLINMLIWASFVLSQILRFYYNLIISGSLLSLSFAVGIVMCGKYLDCPIQCGSHLLVLCKTLVNEDFLVTHLFLLN